MTTDRERARRARRRALNDLAGAAVPPSDAPAQAAPEVTSTPRRARRVAAPQGTDVPDSPDVPPKISSRFKSGVPPRPDEGTGLEHHVPQPDQPADGTPAAAAGVLERLLALVDTGELVGPVGFVRRLEGATVALRSTQELHEEAAPRVVPGSSRVTPEPGRPTTPTRRRQCSRRRHPR